MDDKQHVRLTKIENKT